MSTATDVKIDSKIKNKIQAPKKWKVILLNDDTTPIDFVVKLLTETFKHTPESAKKITLEIHTDGKGIAGTYSFEIAEAKAVEATTSARAGGFPLQCKIEEE